MDCIWDLKVVDLRCQSARLECHVEVFISRIPLLTVLNEKIPTTLSHGVPSFGCHPVRLLRALDRQSDLSKNSSTDAVRPVRPQVNGLRLLSNGRRPYFSSLRKSAIEIESGISDPETHNCQPQIGKECLLGGKAVERSRTTGKTWHP